MVWVIILAGGPNAKFSRTFPRIVVSTRTVQEGPFLTSDNYREEKARNLDLVHSWCNVIGELLVSVDSYSDNFAISLCRKYSYHDDYGRRACLKGVDFCCCYIYLMNLFEDGFD